MSISNRGLLVLALVLLAGNPAPAQEPRKDQYGDPLPPGAIARLGTVRLRSHHNINHVALSPDGKLLATWGGDSPIQVWDGVTGQLRREIPTFKYKVELTPGLERTINEEIAALAFAADARKLHVLTRNGILRTCDISDGKWSEPLARTAGPVEPGFHFAMSSGRASPDGTHFAFRPDVKPYRVEVFALGRDKPILEIKEEKLGEEGGRPVLSADNKLVAIPLTDNTVKVWEVVSGRHVATYTGPDLRLINVEFSPDGKSIAGVYWPKVDRLRPDESGTLIVWDTATGKERLRVPEWQGFVGGYTPDGSKLLGVGRKELCVADPATGKVTGRLKGHSPLSEFPGFGFSADGKRIATCGGRDSAVIVWDLATEKPVLDIDAPCGGVNTLAISPDGKSIFSGTSEENAAYLWDAESGRPKHRLVLDRKGPLLQIPQCATFTPDGHHLLVGYSFGETTGTGKDWSVGVWQVADGKLVREFTGHTNGVREIAISPDGKVVGTRDHDENPKLRVWDFDTGKLTREIEWANSFQFLKESELIGVASHPGGMNEVKNLLSGKVLGTWKVDGRARAVAVSPDGRLAVVQDEKRETGPQVGIRNALTGELIARLPQWAAYGKPTAFSPDGKVVAVVQTGYPPETGGDAVQFFTTDTAKNIRTIQGHKGWISKLAFSSDGKRLATGGRDNTVLVWDLTKP